jgi:hypothetical protein
MKYWSLFLILIFFFTLVQAETTFFENPDGVFIMGDSPVTGEL